MRKVLKDNVDLGFRIQLAKSSLQIDTTPTETSVMTYANHLLAEVEQIAYQDKKKKKEDRPAGSEPKLKRLEDAKGDGKGARDGDKGGQRTHCRFFLTEGGCKKGKACSWPHVMDDQRRCWTCGSLQHYAPACDRPKEAMKDGGSEKGAKGDAKGGRPAVRQVRREDGGKEDGVGGR